MEIAVIVCLCLFIAVALLCKVVGMVGNERRYGHGEHHLIIYPHRGKPQTYESRSPGRLHRRRSKALKRHRVASVEIVYANGTRELTTKLQKVRQHYEATAGS